MMGNFTILLMSWVISLINFQDVSKFEGSSCTSTLIHGLWVSLHKIRTVVQALITLCHQKVLEDLHGSCPFYHVKYHLLNFLFKTVLKLPLTYIHFTLSTVLNTNL